MQIVIDINDEIYKEILNGKDGWSNYVHGLIRTGTPLPKGHGDLIDRNDLLQESYCIDDWGGNEVNIVDVMTVKMADAIIEADKAESEE